MHFHTALKKPVVFIWKVSIQHGIKLRVWWSMKVLNVSIQKCCSIWDLTSRKVHYHTPLHSLDDSIWTWKWKLLYTMENLTKFSLYITKNFFLVFACALNPHGIRTIVLYFIFRKFVICSSRVIFLSYSISNKTTNFRRNRLYSNFINHLQKVWIDACL